MSTNESVEAEDLNEGEENETEVDTPGEQPKPAKPKRTPEEELEYFEGRAKRLRKQLGHDEPEPEKPAPTTKSDELGFSEKAYLKSYGISGSDELALVKQWKKRTGEEIDVFIEDDIFTAKLAKLRDARAVQDALPSGSKRVATPAINTVDYWIAKGEMPPNTPENEQLRYDIVNAKAKKTKGGQFYNS